MSVNIYLKGDYEEFYALKAAKNKAKQSQIRLPLSGHGGGFDFEQQVGTADVANDRYPGPVEIAFY